MINMADKDFVFIVTYGRSGSTLTMGVLNSVDGFSICGENNMALYDLYKMYLKMHGSINSFHTNFMSEDSRNSWYQVIDVPVLKQACRDFAATVFSVNHESKVVGFKEIRWKSIEDLECFLDWLYMVFDCRFIFLTRNLDETCNSKWHKANPDCHKQLKEFEERVEEYIKGHPYQHWYHLHFDTLHDSDKSLLVRKFTALLVWVGVDFDSGLLNDTVKRFHGY